MLIAEFSLRTRYKKLAIIIFPLIKSTDFNVEINSLETWASLKKLIEKIKLH